MSKKIKLMTDEQINNLAFHISPDFVPEMVRDQCERRAFAVATRFLTWYMKSLGLTGASPHLFLKQFLKEQKLCKK